jgi:hydrogenase expression/formation protein HypC
MSMCLAVPGCVVSIEGADAFRRGVVRFGGIERSVSLAFVPDAAVGDYVLVHVGFALSRIDEKDAAAVFEYLREIDALSQELS